MSQLMRDDYKYTYVGAAATTQVATGNCRLIRIVLNTVADGTLNIIDGISGSTTNVALITTTAANPPVAPYDFGIKLTTGLRIISTGNSDFTVVWTPN